MTTAVIEDMDYFKAFLAAQPLCKWAAQKQREIAAGVQTTRGRSTIHHPHPKDDNAELAAALSSMA
jgi:hypothetical protein